MSENKQVEKYTLGELVRNNCSCCAQDKACDICDIDKQVALAVKEWLEQKRQLHCMQTGQKHQCEGTDMLDELIDELGVKA